MAPANSPTENPSSPQYSSVASRSGVLAVACVCLVAIFTWPVFGQSPVEYDPPLTAGTDSLLADPVSIENDAAFYGGLIDTIYVHASRIVAPTFNPGPALMTLVPLADAVGGADLAELLTRTVGLQMRRYGGLGAPTIPSIRGCAGAQVVVLLDGMPVGDAQDGAVDLATLPLERFAAAEVHRGLVPAGFGGVGGMGAVNLLSVPAVASGSDVRLFTGSFGDRGGRAMRDWVSADGRRSLLALIHGRTITNDYVFLDHNQTFYNADDDSTRARANAQFSEWGAYLHGRLETERLNLGLAVGGFRKDGGRPGPLAYTSPHASIRYETADCRFSLADNRQLWRCDIAATRRQEYLFDRAGEVGGLGMAGGTTEGIKEDIHCRLAWSPARDFGSHRTGWMLGRATLRVGGSARRQWYRESLRDVVDPLRVRSTVTAFTGVQVDLYGPRLTLNPAWRWEMAEDDFPPISDMPWLGEPPPEYHRHDAVSPSLAVVWEVSPGRLFVESHLSQAVRQPTWVELFGHRGGIAGNRELLAEDITSRDLAIRFEGRRGGFRAAIFSARTDNAIVFLQNSQRTSQAQNLGRISTTGVEFEASGGLPAGGSWSTNVTWQEAVDQSVLYTGKEIPFLPPLEWHGQFEIPYGLWRLGASATYESTNYRDRYNLELDRAPSRTMFNLSLARDILSWVGENRLVTMTLAAINLADNDVYDVEGFPLPGRSFRFTLHWR